MAQCCALTYNQKDNTMNGPIYQPAGRAREYSPYALNIYTGCTHGCDYCYCPRVLHMDSSAYFHRPSPRSGIVSALTRQLASTSFDKQVLLSFVGDCFCDTSDDSATALECLDILRDTKTPTAILTKGGNRLFRAEGQILGFQRGLVSVGATLTFANDKDSHDHEPGAASPAERMDTLRMFHEAGVKTFASFEPVLDPEQSLALIRECAESGILDTYKVGKLNGHPLASTIDWRRFLDRAVEILRGNGCDFYIKDDLAAFGRDLRFSPRERDTDAHIVRTRTA